MNVLQQKLAEILPEVRQRRATINKEHGEVALSTTTIGQLLGGMRGIPALLCETSSVSPDTGLKIRNIPILDLVSNTPQEIFFLLCTGSLPTDSEKQQLRTLFSEKAEVPSYVWNVLEVMPKDSHPMSMLSTAIVAMQRESVYAKKYSQGASKDELWLAAVEDSITLISRISNVAAGIYRLRFNKGPRIAPDASLSWSENYANMLGVSQEDSFKELIRLYLVLHSDHEGGNVSAMTSHTVSSALSDVYYSVSAGLNGLAGPLHGLANQECLAFINEVMEELGGVPSDEQLTKYLWDRLNSGRVVPGFGHAVLRATDPRYTAFYNFAQEHNLQDDVMEMVRKLFAIVPNVLLEHGKAKNPWPNVDAISGALLQHYGLVEFDYYTVMFGVSRAIGICSQIIYHRMVNSPIVRPKSMTIDELEAKIAKG